ncbi:MULTISPECIES: hypothetical protein [Acidobacteriaceae]|uniref:hypothetical protein n=1 Tax=Acidobacteriaceae TaxID=204434 RepID=UPI00131E0A76|nr:MULTISPECIES: hypothetical protein [Acidobacteriaceae]MDW5264382.1 hypothetical protein [Edaphobacter sp.]
MRERPSFKDNLTGIVTRSLAGFTLSSALWLMTVIWGGFAFLGFSLWLSGEEDLFIAPWWMRIIQGLFIVAVIAVSYRIARHLPTTTSRYTGRPSSTYTMPYVAAVFCFLVSHGLLWGGLHHLHPGREITLRGTVTASGIRHGKASGGHGDWVDLQLQGHPGITHLETNESFAIYSDNGAQDTYQCSLNDTRPGDTLDLRGNQSQWGFAVTRFIPINQRLLQACSTSR